LKFHLLLKGPPRIGKTTLIFKSIPELKKNFKIDGFITREIRERGERVGFEIERINGEKMILSHVNFINFPKVGKYGVNVENFEKIVKEINTNKCDILIIDEIGKMELLSKKFYLWIKDLLEVEKPRILATIGEKVFEKLKNEISFSKCEIIDVNYNNRNYLLKDIFNFFKKSM